ncbi:MAG TPA: carbon monoxide dehydrogenase [Desulfobacterales bacterium]|nr:carbon monoxide dehydrogenase [Desulfobacterales bacterium]HIP38807.1 carbon monoxide dehydrogenase [Desulfocapsa sulfexigens]
MTKVIAMAGKGGTGKTTTSALLTRYLLDKKQTPLLLVDADANANLNELLGLDVNLTLGQIRKELKSELPPNITRDQFMEMKIHQALIEESGFDLLVMGQPDGPGCYCAANQYLAMTMDKLAENYKYIIVDNEAGMEHLSRMNLRTVDYLLVTSDPSARGILTAKRISDITGPLGLEVKNQYLLVNRAPQPVPPALQEKIDEAVTDSGMELGGIIPSSDALINQELSGESYLNLDVSADVIVTVNEMFDRIFS